MGSSSQPHEGPCGQGLCPARQVSGPLQWCTWQGRQACPFSPKQSLLCSRRPSGLQGREDRRAADGPRVSDFQPSGGSPGGSMGRGPAPLSPASGSSQPLLPEGGWEGQGGRWGRGLSGHHHCHLEQGGGETGPTPGLSRGVGFSSVRGILRRLDSGPTAIGEAHRTTLGLSFLVRTTGVHLRRIHGTLASCRARLRAPEK